jgi:hypothetical protein
MPATTNLLGLEPLRRPGKDWTARLPPGSPSADPNMVAQPYADPGYAMPNAFVGNLNQAPGQEVGGALPASLLDYINLLRNQGNSNV